MPYDPADPAQSEAATDWGVATRVETGSVTGWWHPVRGQKSDPRSSPSLGLLGQKPLPPHPAHASTDAAPIGQKAQPAADIGSCEAVEAMNDIHGPPRFNVGRPDSYATFIIGCVI
jgi:hypothetical protein